MPIREFHREIEKIPISKTTPSSGSSKSRAGIAPARLFADVIQSKSQNPNRAQRSRVHSMNF
jgi:hypothetical protein